MLHTEKQEPGKTYHVSDVVGGLDFSTTQLLGQRQLRIQLFTRPADEKSYKCKGELYTLCSVHGQLKSSPPTMSLVMVVERRPRDIADWDASNVASVQR